MSELMEKVQNIIHFVNDECADLDANDRSMVLLLVTELCKSKVKKDIIDTMRGRVGK